MFQKKKGVVFTNPYKDSSSNKVIDKTKTKDT